MLSAWCDEPGTSSSSKKASGFPGRISMVPRLVCMIYHDIRCRSRLAAALFKGGVNVTKLIARNALISLLWLVAAAQAWAQYPAKPIRLIVPAAPGGGTDITARSFVPALSENLGQPIIIENRGGAGGVIGTDVVAKAAPDGYTLLMVYVSHATNPTLVTKLPYDTLKDFTPITLISHEPTVLVTHP